MDSESKNNKSTQGGTQQWKKNDIKAQKNGSHRTIYWVKTNKKQEDGTFKGEKWKQDCRYNGEWKDNKKHGFGIQIFGNGDKYEGGWMQNMRYGKGTQWVNIGKGKLWKEYTGDWAKDRKTGRGSQFFQNGDRYDGTWLDDLPHGEGRMIYSEGDVYEGMWFEGKKSGYGVLTKRSGDHFEGHWIEDQREGQGSYFYSQKNQVFIGEWVNDMPRAGIYSEVLQQEQKPPREQNYDDEYVLPDIPVIGLKNTTDVLKRAMEKTRRDRTDYRAKYIPLDELFEKQELEELIQEFRINDEDVINIILFEAVLSKLEFELSGTKFQCLGEEIKSYILKVKENPNFEQIDFDTFARVFAILLEDSNALKNESQRSQSQHILDDEEFNENDDNEFDDEYL